MNEKETENIALLTAIAVAQFAILFFQSDNFLLQCIFGMVPGETILFNHLTSTDNDNSCIISPPPKKKQQYDPAWMAFCTMFFKHLSPRFNYSHSNDP